MIKCWLDTESLLDMELCKFWPWLLSYGARARSDSECMGHFLELRSGFAFFHWSLTDPKKNSEVILNGELKLMIIEGRERTNRMLKI